MYCVTTTTCVSVTVGVVDVVATVMQMPSPLLCVCVAVCVGPHPCAPPAAPSGIGTVASPGKALCMLGYVVLTTDCCNMYLPGSIGPYDIHYKVCHLMC